MVTKVPAMRPIKCTRKKKNLSAKTITHVVKNYENTRKKISFVKKKPGKVS